VFSALYDGEFDRINYNPLFLKPVERNVLKRIIRLLVSWYRNQTMQVK